MREMPREVETIDEMDAARRIAFLFYRAMFVQWMQEVSRIAVVRVLPPYTRNKRNIRHRRPARVERPQCGRRGFSPTASTRARRSA